MTDARTDRPPAQQATAPKLMVVAALTAVLFFFGLLLFERIPEIPVDVDFKPFFIPLLFVALLPFGRTTMAVALGAALGEAIGDILEGYEIDDPIGFVGYFVGFALAGWVIANRPLNWARLTGAAMLAGTAQAFIEASSFLIFGAEALSVAVLSALGNSFIHGFLLGVLPLIPLVFALHGRIERFLGYQPLSR